eukprot:UN03279
MIQVYECRKNQRYDTLEIINNNIFKECLGQTTLDRIWYRKMSMSGRWYYDEKYFDITSMGQMVL